MKTLAFSYDSSSRQLSGGDVMAGTTADSGFRICISNHANISGTLQIICGVVVRSGSELVRNPVIDCDGDGIASVTSDIIQATSGTLPISLLVTHDDGTVEASAPTVLMLAVVPGPLGGPTDGTVYSDVLMTRTSDWSWRSAWTYQAGSIAVHGRALYISLKSDNLGHEPSASSEWWAEYYLSPDLIALLSGLTEPIQTALDSIRASVSSEASARESADTAEAGTRASEDAAIRSDLSAEVSARKAADSAEASARESAVSAEASARAKAVSDEASTRASADSALQTAVDGKAPIAHASTGTEYGVGSATQYGHVRVDSALSSTSTNPVQNKAVQAALATKQGTLTWDTAPTAGSANPVTSGGIKTAIDAEASARAAAVSAEATARAKAVSDEASARQAADESEASARQTADSALQASIDALGTAAHKDTGTSSGQVPILGAGGKLPNSVIPDLAISAYLGEAEDYAHLTALRGQQGDYAVVKGTSATSGTYILSTGTGSEASDWVRLSGPGDLSGGPGITVSGAVVSLSASGVTAGSKGSAVQIPTVTVDQYGRVTALGGATVYPPTTAGTSGQVWRSDGSGAGVWETPDAAPTANSAHLVLSKGVKSAVDAEASARASAVSAEASARAKAVSDEASARSSADSALQSAIDAEASARSGAVSDEATARQEADAALQTAVEGRQLPVKAGTDISIGTDGRTINASAQRPVAGAGIAVSGRTVALASSGATAGTYGGASAIPQLTVDAYGRITKAATVAPAAQTPTAGAGIAVSGRQVSLASSGVHAGTYGSAAAVPVLVIDAYGRVTGVSTEPIYPPTTAGTAGQLWQSDGSGQGVWQTLDTAPAADSVKAVTSGGVKAAIDAEASARASADSALQGTVDGKAAKTEALGTGTALALGGGTGARTLTLTRRTVSGASSSSAVTIPDASYSASGLMTAAQAVRLDAALPAATPQVYAATIPQTDYLDVCLAQYVRIGLDKGLLSFSGHMRDISLPSDVWALISVDTVMSAMGLTHKRPSAYRRTGWWHYDDGDDHGDRYGSGTVCQVSPAGGLELGRFYSGTDVGDWEMSNIGRGRYISVRDVYVEIQ